MQTRAAISATRKAAPKQIRCYADKAAPTEVSSILEGKIRGVSEEASLTETGRVLSVGFVETKSIDLWATYPFRPSIWGKETSANGYTVEMVLPVSTA